MTTTTDPTDPNAFKRRRAAVRGKTYSFLDAGKGRNYAVLCHGFPDSSYGWRFQIGPLAAIGFRVIVPDMIGYGQTDAPAVDETGAGLEAYTLESVCADLVALLDAIDAQEVGGSASGSAAAVWIGHDWGGAVVWRMALHHRERVKAVASVCTPFSPPTKEYVALEEMVKRLPNFAYQIVLADPKTAKEVSADVSGFVDVIFFAGADGAPSHGPQSVRDTLVAAGYKGLRRRLSPIERSACVAALRGDGRSGGASGPHGAFNWYRTRALNHADETHLPRTLTGMNALLVVSEGDEFLVPSLSQNADRFVPGIQVRRIAGADAGHWALIEAPNQINSILCEFLKDVQSGSKL